MAHPKQGDLAAYLAKQTKADAKNAGEEDTEFSTIASPLGDDFDDVVDISDEELEQQALDHGGADDNPHTPE